MKLNKQKKRRIRISKKTWKTSRAKKNALQYFMGITKPIVEFNPYNINGYY